MSATMISDAAEYVVLAHGGGGQLTHHLIAERIVPRLANRLLDPLDDGAVIPPSSHETVFTTDAFVVQPLEFPGGDIGRLAVCGTVNDLAVMGARPRVLSLALVIEEGLPLATLDRIVDSIAGSAAEAGVVVATGDTKVVERRGGDGLIVTTAGMGERRGDVRLSLARVAAGDRVIVTGGLAEHGLAIMSVREGLGFESGLRSDAAPLNGMIGEILDTGADVKFMRDPTRGGLAGVLNDIVDGAGLGVRIDEAALPIAPAVRHTAELLGIDPLTVANEGKCVIVVAEGDAGKVLAACRAHRYGRKASIVGTIVTDDAPLVELHTAIGGARIVQRPYGEDLPRIC